MKAPFHYEVEFTYWNKDEQTINSLEPKVFINEQPINARNKAFELFNDYENFVATHNSININELSKNEKIRLVEFSIDGKNLDTLTKDELNQIATLMHRMGIVVYLVLDVDIDEDDIKGKRFPIHGILTRFDRFEYWESLYWENCFYDIFKLNKNGKEVEATFYHPDDVEIQTEMILKTPINWDDYAEPNAEDLEYIELLNKRITERDKLTELTSKILDKEIGDLSVKDITSSFVQHIFDNNLSETEALEFKSSLLYNFKTGRAGISIKQKIARSICSFLNTNGGLLLIGIRDPSDTTNDGNSLIQGIDFDFSLCEKSDKMDWFERQFADTIEQFIGNEFITHIKSKFVEVEGKNIYAVLVKPHYENGVFLLENKDGKTSKYFFIRSMPSTREIRGAESIEKYLRNRESK